MREHGQAFADSARDVYLHLEREAESAAGHRASSLAASTAHSPAKASIGQPTVEYGHLAPQADARGLWRTMAEAGWLGILVAEAHGGLGLTEEDAMTIAEVAGRHPRQPALLVAATQVASCLDGVQAANAQELLARFLAGDVVPGLAWQERSGQLEATTSGAMLRPTAGGWRLSGRKSTVSPVAQADGWIVLAADASGPVLVWVSADADGLQPQVDDCADGSDVGSLVFTDVHVAMRDVLVRGHDALARVQRANDRARLVQSAMLTGLADQVLQQTLEYLRTRVQFGKALGSFQVLQHRCVDAYLDIEVARACLADVSQTLQAHPDRLPYLASRAKARTAAMGIRVARIAIQLHGAIGATDELPVSGFFRRALHLSAWLGNTTAHQQRCLRLRVSRETSADAPRIAYPADAALEDLDEEQFRAAVRDFLEQNFPKKLRFLPRNAKWSEWKPWFQTLGRKGWAAPSWPKEHGGLGLSQSRLLAMLEEQEGFGVPRAPTESSVGMLGQLLLRHGSDAQKQRLLPGILSGETIWCQGYSEPNAGSDLASLRTSAKLEGDHFVVNGQKIWTSMAAEATHMFALVRTRDDGPKQAGISFVLIDMRSEGLTVRPIRDMAGHDKFCEVFLDDVRVPLDNLVGPLHGGWTVAKALLGFERLTVGSPNNARVALYQLESLGRARGLFADAVFAQRFVELELDTLDLGALYAGFAAYVKRGEELPASVPLIKLYATETCQRITACTMEAASEDGALMGTLDLDDERIGTAAAHMTALYGFIYAGTNDVQRNILARQVLRLPA